MSFCLKLVGGRETVRSRGEETKVILGHYNQPAPSKVVVLYCAVLPRNFLTEFFLSLLSPLSN